MASAARQLLNSLAGFTADYFGMEQRGEQAAESARQLPAAEQIEFVMAAAAILSAGQSSGMLLDKPLTAVLRRKLAFTPEQILELVRLGANPSYYFPFAQVLRLAASIPMTAELRQALETMKGARVLEPGQGLSDIARRLEEMLAARDESAAFEPAGAWSRKIGPEITPAWREVLEAGSEVSGGDASKKWRQAAAARVSAIGRAAFRAAALRWLALGPCPETPLAQVPHKESDYQRGLVWSLAEFGDAEVCAAVARFAEQCLWKIPMIGAVSQKTGNACIRALAAMDGMEPISQLARLALRIKYQTAQRLTQQALDGAAARQGISRDELTEITVPDFGLSAGGVRIEQLGAMRAELSAEGELRYFPASGKPLKGATEEAKRDFAGELKELKQAAKEIIAMHAAHRTRVERLLLSQREIPLETWRAAYLDHPLIGAFARKLIWQFSSGATALWNEGGLADWAGAPVEPAGTARLWHPIHSDVQTVLSWRCRLEDRRIRQPFKQAHREVYVLTDAERETRTYSNRFAGHVLKQHQFAALCEQRGWRFRLMGQWDSHNTPYLELPELGLRVEYLVDFPRDEAVSGHAVYLYLATGQARFADAATNLPRELSAISPVLFSEAMRDIDLFVGVASIGNDPLWGRQAQQPFGEYWQRFSFGELSTLAEQRREILARMLPQLPIGDRCRLEGRFLTVRGERATYKIHLGSGNVLMEPGSRYLCIVRGPAASGVPSQVFLPFEGDVTLSLILSKAFLLAADRKITDPSITSQLP